MQILHTVLLLLLLLLLLMDFNSFGSSSFASGSLLPSSSAKQGKSPKKSSGELTEEDFLGRLGVVDGSYSHGVVDCSLRLGLPPAFKNGTTLLSSSYSSTSQTDGTNAVNHLVSSPLPCATASVVPSSNSTTGFVVTEFCTMCAAKNTPLWRTGPYGPKSLCNACGIRYKKEERRLALSLGIPSTQCHSKRRQQSKKSF